MPAPGGSEWRAAATAKTARSTCRATAGRLRVAAPPSIGAAHVPRTAAAGPAAAWVPNATTSASLAPAGCRRSAPLDSAGTPPECGGQPRSARTRGGGVWGGHEPRRRFITCPAAADAVVAAVWAERVRPLAPPLAEADIERPCRPRPAGGRPPQQSRAPWRVPPWAQQSCRPVVDSTRAAHAARAAQVALVAPP